MLSSGLQNPLTVTRDNNNRLRLRGLFPDLVDHPGTTFLSLRPYLGRYPERFFDKHIHRLMLDWLKDRNVGQPAQLQQYFVQAGPELSAALVFLRQINSEDWHDRPLVEGDEYEAVQFIDRTLHPVYLRLVEGVFASLIRPVAYFARLDRGASTEGLDVFNLVEELRDGPMDACVGAYHHLMRNGIGHGGITYLQHDIRYRDKKGNSETLDVWSVVRLCDDMVDTCNALASAIKTFLILYRGAGYVLPHELLVDELIEETSSPWWAIRGCVGSELADSTQLIIYAHPKSRDVLKVQWATLQSAILAELLAPGYNRYFFSLRTKKALPGWAAFNGESLREIRESGATEVHEYADALDGPIFYVPAVKLPRLLARIVTLAQSMRLQWPIAREEIRVNLQLPDVLGRQAKMHRNGWRYVLNGAVVLPDSEADTVADTIRARRRRIIRHAARTAKAATPRLSLARYLPLGYARIAVLSSDFRRRRLNGFGLGPELICTVQLQRIRRIKSPDIMGSTIESSGKWRIAWNRKWIESGGRVATDDPPD